MLNQNINIFILKMNIKSASLVFDEKESGLICLGFFFGGGRGGGGVGGGNKK